MTKLERVEKIADICATSVMVDVDLLREVSDIARAALEERDKLISERADVTDWLNQELEQDRDVWKHLAQERKKERDGYKAQLVETLKAHNENGEVLARLQRRLEEAERVIEPLVCERDRLKWELDNAGVTNIEDGTAETWDTIPDNYYQDPRITKSQLEAAAAWMEDTQDG